MNDDSVIGNHHLNSFGIRLGKFPALESIVFEGILNAWEMKFFQTLFSMFQLLIFTSGTKLTS